MNDPTVFFPPLPQFPDPGRSDFRAEINEQIIIIKSQLKLLEDAVGREQRDTINELLYIEGFTLANLSREKTLIDLMDVCSRLNDIKNEEWGDETGKVREIADGALQHLYRYEAFVALSERFKSYLGRLSSGFPD